MKESQECHGWGEFARAHLASATGTPDSSGSDLRLAHICRMNAAFRLGALCNLAAVTRCARLARKIRF